ncbi:glycosyltransferase [Geobacter sp. DSM 9736]|uniref:CgeB family protein n=1 Tax=Geobacter sp. DSM 9736 TaxID=1277350 RepID=UPI000B4FD7F7|nr:glycosyltransferase [Geobacter sp. DSM 9736]SNB47493.1 Spore maturation protein CgeB [Geobacter sp. DSM 9736]
MKFVLFYHSIVSDWNHGNAHFLRGIASELISRGHHVDVYEPEAGWSLTNLLREQGEIAIRQFRRTYPLLEGKTYRMDRIDPDRLLAGADVVIVHEWNDHELVRRLGEHHRKKGGYLLFFHDTHHRSVTEAKSMSAYDLSHYDGVLAYGKKIRDIYLKSRWAKNVWVWHEAADVRVFSPQSSVEPEGDVVWVGNWGDEERSEEIREFLIEPVRRLRLKATVYGVRYPQQALRLLEEAGIRYGGWLPNFDVPKVFSRHRVTVHIPRRPYATLLPGIPTIRPFEALSCGIPLVSAPWHDVEGLFAPGEDFLVARNGNEATELLDMLLHHPTRAEELASHGRRTIIERHTCGHRVNELLQICRELGMDTTERPQQLRGKG